MRTAKIARATEYLPCFGEIKEASDTKYQIGGWISVKNNIDLGDDRVINGAYTRTLSDAYARKSQQHLDYLFPYLWSHDYNQLPLGGVFDAEEDSHGLYAKIQFNPDVQMAREAYSSFKLGTLSKQSIGYKAIQTSWEKFEGRSIRNLEEIAVMEGSAVIFPMNPLASVDTVKSEAGRRFYYMPTTTKDFNSSYQEQQQDDWQYADWYDITCALQESIQDCFTESDNPLQALESDVLPGLMAALRLYVSNGIDLGAADYLAEQNTSTGMYDSMSAGSAHDEKAGRVLSAATRTTLQRIATGISGHVDSIRSVQERDRANALQGYQVYSSSARPALSTKAGLSDAHHGILDKATSGIMGHVKSLKSMAATAQRTNDLRAWPIVSASSARPVYLSKEEAQEVDAQLSALTSSLQLKNDLNESAEDRSRNAVLDSQIRINQLTKSIAAQSKQGKRR